MYKLQIIRLQTHQKFQDATYKNIQIPKFSYDQYHNQISEMRSLIFWKLSSLETYIEMVDTNHQGIRYLGRIGNSDRAVNVIEKVLKSDSCSYE